MDEEQVSDREKQARQNRARMPLTAAELDAWRAIFGPGVKLVWAREGEHSVGRCPVEAVA